MNLSFFLFALKLKHVFARLARTKVVFKLFNDGDSRHRRARRKLRSALVTTCLRQLRCCCCYWYRHLLLSESGRSKEKEREVDRERMRACSKQLLGHCYCCCCCIREISEYPVDGRGEQQGSNMWPCNGNGCENS